MKIKESPGAAAFRLVNGFIMLMVVAATLYPFMYLVAQSLSSEAAIVGGKVTLLPVEFTAATYAAVLTKPNFFVYYGNTILYAVVGTLIAVSSTAVISYPLSKNKLRLNKFVIPFVLFTMYFGGGLIPNYILIAQFLKMRDTIWAIVIPGAISAYYVLIMRAFFISLPDELEEAAAMDGLTVYGIFLRIVLPLSKPVLSTMVLFNMVGLWNNWFGPALYLQTKDKWPVALFLRQLIDSAINVNEFGVPSDMAAQISANIKSCAMVLTMLPIICVYPFIQKYFVKGMMIGAVKG